MQHIPYNLKYSGAHISWHKLFLAGNQVNHQNLVPSMLTYKCWLISWGWTKKKVQKGSFSPFLSLRQTAWQSHWCHLHQSILLTQGPICEILAKLLSFWWWLKNSVFLSRPFWFFFCFILTQISHHLWGAKDLKFWWLPWFPAKS